MTSLRTHLTLGRVSNLATVWSNLLCAWIIVGRSDSLQLASFLLGGSLLYLGGMYLNDYFDRDFDQQYRPERPIPSGQIAPATVRGTAVGLLAAGFAAIAWNGPLTAAFSLLLVACIVLYDLLHKRNAAAPVFMAGCRACLYLVVASAFANGNGIDHYHLIAAGTMFLFVLGVTYLARSESNDKSVDTPAIALVAAPLLGAFYFRSDFFDVQRGAVLALLGAWTGLAFLRARVDGRLVIGKAIAPLLAAIPLLDLLVLSTLGLASQPHLFLFAGLFALTTAAQRFIPAT